MSALLQNLVGDIGGTRARFALLSPSGHLTPPREFAVADFPTPEAAIAEFLAQCGQPPLTAAAFAIAAPVNGEMVPMSNAQWVFFVPQLKERFGLSRILLLNDFAALALSLPVLPPGAARQVGRGCARSRSTAVVVGPGTGLGIAALCFDGVRPHAIAGEGGHATLAPGDEREAALLELARRDCGHVSAEDLVSGRGLPLLHRLLGEVDGRRDALADTPSIVAAAQAGEPAATASLDMFCALLGSVAGNLALTFGAHSGVFIGGGIVPRLGRRFDESPFRARFEAKGRFETYLAAIPTSVIVTESPALLGLATALADREFRHRVV